MREICVTGKEVDEWMSSHSADDMRDVLKGYISDIETFCRSLTNLYDESKVPLAVMGVHVKIAVSMSDGESGRSTLLESRIGAPFSLLDSMEQAMSEKGHAE